MAERITVKRASELTGLSQLSIRLGLQCKDLPFGTAIKTSSKRTVYHISPSKLAEYLGMTVEEVKERSNA
jgi:predicted HTH domain antitoxin